MARKRKKEQKHSQPRRRRGTRGFWSGTITFGLVSIPVELFPANRKVGVSFRLLDDDGTPVQRRYYCPEDQKDVHPEHILRGFPVDRDEYVIVRDEELEAVEPKKTREIDLRQFVDLAEISPMFFQRSYFLVPRGDSNKAYRLLAGVMEENGRAGIATFVMRNREYLIAILAENGILRGETLRFEDEIRTPETIGLPDREKPENAEVSRLEKLIRKQTAKRLDEKWLQDEYAARVRKLVEKKRKAGKQVVEATAEADTEDDADETPVPDLLETIRRSLHGGNGRSNGRSRNKSNNGLQQKTREELYEQAKQLDIPGRSKLNKQQLIREIAKAT